MEKTQWLLVLALFAASSGAAHAAQPSNWSGNYAPCEHHDQLRSQDYADLGVRISSANPALDRAFRRAMSFWRDVLDIDWHEVTSDECAIALVDGTKSLFETPAVVARAQMPEREAFEGWIAFNPAARLTERQMFVISVHEIGHLLGLPHNPSGASVMYFFTLDESVWLDAADLRELGRRHKLRAGAFEKGRMVSRR